MPETNQWTCEGCGHKQVLRKIDYHRWITSSVSPSGEPLGSARIFELCPACHFRLRFSNNPEFQELK